MAHTPPIIDATQYVENAQKGTSRGKSTICQTLLPFADYWFIRQQTHKFPITKREKTVNVRGAKTGSRASAYNRSRAFDFVEKQSDRRVDMCFRPASGGVEIKCPSCGKTLPVMGGTILKKCPFCKKEFDDADMANFNEQLNGGGAAAPAGAPGAPAAPGAPGAPAAPGAPKAPGA